MDKQSINIVGLGGSLSTTSTSLSALKIALDGAAEAGAETHLIDIRLLNLPMYTPELSETSQSVIEFSEAIHKADGLIWSSPLYHGTISGSFKNALDWLELLSNRKPPYLTYKVVGLISTAGGTQGLQAVNTMEFIVRALRGWAVPLVIPIPRAVGPALGGLIVAAAGAYAAFILNAVTFLGVIVVLYRWRRKPSDSALPSERLFGAMKAGLRYVRQSEALRSVLVRSGVFIIFASAMWALMPLVARTELGRGPAGYWMLLTSFGLSAVLGATVLPIIRRRISIDTIVAGTTILFALVLLSFAYLRIFSLLCAVTLELEEPSG